MSDETVKVRFNINGRLPPYNDEGTVIGSYYIRAIKEKGFAPCANFWVHTERNGDYVRTPKQVELIE
ncbi:MAG: hypothetical protein JW754_03845 [Candidatus Aenigmarchaeota archaeon]|nr:hypothetical protein [Candidatus Aenigmarchaeota archaeon]